MTRCARKSSLNLVENRKKPQDGSCAAGLESKRLKLEPRIMRKFQQALRSVFIKKLIPPKKWCNF